MTLYIIVHISKGQTFYRATAKEMENGLDRGWTTNIDRAELYKEEELPAAFASMAVSTDDLESK